MPLFMDIHTVESDTFSVEDVVKAHMQDLAIQDRFKVKQLKYWVNIDAKTLFCLMEGPNKEACNSVHLESHGNTACNIIEVADDEFNLFLGEGTDLNDLAQTTSGNIDTGYRTILLAGLIDFTGKNENVKEEVKEIIVANNGVLISQPGNALMASFVLAAQAISCALEINKIIQLIPHKFEFSISIASGRPVDETGNTMFEETKEKNQCIGAIGAINKIYLDSNTLELSANSYETTINLDNNIEIVRSADFIFLIKLFRTLLDSTNKLNFKSKDFHTILGLSKSKAYRKILSLTGMAPNQLIQEFRLRQSLFSIMQQEQTIAEIGYGLGYNSPSYFTKVFQKRFGLTPTSFAQSQISEE